MVYSKEDHVLDDMMTKTSSRDWRMLSKLCVPLYGLPASTQKEPAGQRNPLPCLGPSILPMPETYPCGVSSSSKWPPQNWAVFVKFFTPAGSIQTQFRRRLDLKLCTPTMEKSSQKKPIKNATLTRIGAAFFRLRRMTLGDVSIASFFSRDLTHRGTAGEI